MKVRTISRILGTLTLLALIATPAFASPDLSGTWSGTVSGAVTGTISLTIADTGDTGTFAGSIATDRGSLSFDGTFVQMSRRIVGTLNLPGGASVRFQGRSNRAGERLVWHFLLPGGGRVDIEVQKTA